ncbi:MAG: primosomal protein N' [Acidaminococcaceae bacterium]|nr:primosomal protein N' [Acidaminococcaceae bacterium]
MKYVLVAINLPVKNLFRQFIYSLPPALLQAEEGWRVIVPFGPQKVEGFVVRSYAEQEAVELLRRENPDFSPAKIKPVIAALGTRSWFSREMLATAKWLSRYYMCSLAEAMRLFIPGKSSIKRQPMYKDGKLVAYEIEERLKAKTVLAYTVTEAGRAALQAENKRARAQMSALRQLAERTEPLDVKEAEALRISSATLRTLAEKGWACRTEKRLLRNSYDRQAERTETLQLTGEQANAVAAVTDSLQSAFANRNSVCGIPREFLLQGITGSGKTEVYLRATEYALKQGKQVLVLVPEIALTAQIVRRFQAWFRNEVAVAHSKLSQNERGDVWYKMLTGEANVLIGVRSAVFAPFKDLGLVIIDEEQENSYKQEERPAYHAREVARCRCQHSGAVLLMGSATPSLETYYRASSGSIGYLKLTERPGGSLLPEVQVVDMREELAQKNFSVISRKLRREIIASVHAGQQAIVLLNRRGFSTFVMCRDCGETLTCPHCAVSLVYHADEQLMRCHYCGNTYPVPQVCPACGSRRIRFFGSGTQKAEMEISQMPDVTVLRMDQDSTAAKLAHEEIIRKFAAKEANVLLGTQMVAKGHDISNVTLVGILAADSTLNLPDFRASERGFALLTQAAGRAGRGDKPGRVVLQTYDPENQIIALAAKQDYETFAQQELERRREVMYPPFSEILKLTVVDKDEEKAWKLAEAVTAFLRDHYQAEQWERTEILGPFPSGVAKVRDLYRINIVIKSQAMEKVKACLWSSEYKIMRNIYFDVDPITAM